jgi:hypothetical protein
MRTLDQIKHTGFIENIKKIESEMNSLNNRVESQWEDIDSNIYVEISDMIRGLKIYVDELDWSIDINQFDFMFSNEIQLLNGDTVKYSFSYYDEDIVVYEYQFENESYEIKLNRKNIIENVLNGVEIKNFIDNEILNNL